MAKDTHSQRERMLAGDLHLADDPQLLQESRRAEALAKSGGPAAHPWPAARLARRGDRDPAAALLRRRRPESD
jgi:hypothetical protein